MTVKEVKEINEKIQKFFGIGPEDSKKIILALQADREKMRAVVSGDFSCIPDIAKKNCILITKKFLQIGKKFPKLGPEKKTAEKSADGPRKDPDKIPEKDLEKVQGFPVVSDGVNVPEDRKDYDVIPAATLPEDFPEKIEETIKDYMIRYHVDDMRKASAEEWRAACMYVGRVLVIPSLVTIDKNKLISSGVRVYNPDIIDKLMDIWSFLCGTFRKAPLVSDFSAFVGVSYTYLYPNSGKKRLLTTTGIDITKKIQAIQEAGLASGLVDGRKNPTGTIFFLKNWHGWKDSREVVHTGGAAALESGSLPVLALPEGEK